VTGSDLTRVALGELVLLRPVRCLGHVPGVHAAVNAWFGRCSAAAIDDKRLVGIGAGRRGGSYS
jgi:hypothetical protein